MGLDTNEINLVESKAYLALVPADSSASESGSNELLVEQNIFFKLNINTRRNLQVVTLVKQHSFSYPPGYTILVVRLVSRKF